MKLTIQVVQVEDDEAVDGCYELLQELTVAVYLIRRVREGEIFQSYRTVACIIYPGQSVAADG